MFEAWPITLLLFVVLLGSDRRQLPERRRVSAADHDGARVARPMRRARHGRRAGARARPQRPLRPRLAAVDLPELRPANRADPQRARAELPRAARALRGLRLPDLAALSVRRGDRGDFRRRGRLQVRTHVADRRRARVHLVLARAHADRPRSSAAAGLDHAAAALGGSRARGISDRRQAVVHGPALERRRAPPPAISASGRSISYSS